MVAGQRPGEGGRERERSAMGMEKTICQKLRNMRWDRGLTEAYRTNGDRADGEDSATNVMVLQESLEDVGQGKKSHPSLPNVR